MAGGNATVGGDVSANQLISANDVVFATSLPAGSSGQTGGIALRGGDWEKDWAKNQDTVTIVRATKTKANGDGWFVKGTSRYP